MWNLRRVDEWSLLWREIKTHLGNRLPVAGAGEEVIVAGAARGHELGLPVDGLHEVVVRPAVTAPT